MMTKLTTGAIGAIAGVAITIAITTALDHDTRDDARAFAPAARGGESAASARRDEVPRVGDTPAGADVAAPAAEVAALEAELAHVRLVANAPEAVPVAWPDELPDGYREPAFRATVERALHACLPGARLAAVSCEEPPCIALLAFGTPSQGTDGVASWAGSLDGCDAWRRAYGPVERREISFIACTDGRAEEAEVLSLYLEAWPGWEGLEPATRAHVEARRIERIQQLRARATCALKT